MLSEWKKNIDQIKVICINCNQDMILESSKGLKDGILICPGCKEHICISTNPNF